MNYEQSRDILRSQGLPTNNVLVQPVDEPLVQVVENERESVLVIAKRGRYQLIGIDCLTAEVVAFNPPPAVPKTRHVNADLARFLESIKEFNDRYPYNLPNASGSELDRAASNLRAKLDEIDDTAFQYDDGFWVTIVNDVAIGDFGAP